MIIVSIVSHGHGAMVWHLVNEILQFPEVNKIILTINIPEKIPPYVDPKVFLVINKIPKGFAENHNSAFKLFSSDFFCVLNPDVLFNGNPFPQLIDRFSDGRVGLAAPIVLNSLNLIEDSMRDFMTPWSITKRILRLGTDVHTPPESGLDFYPDWIAGMFMLFRAHAYAMVNGFDESYYMYCEDADICTRLWSLNHLIIGCSNVKIIHNAQRSSHRSIKYFFWHSRSMVRYFLKHSYSLPKKIGLV